MSGRGPGIGRRLLVLARGEWGWLALASLCTFATLGSGVGLIATAAYLISRSALVDSTTVLALSITAVRFFAVVRATARYAERYVGHLGTFRILTRIRTWFFRSIEPLAPAGLTDERRGDLLARVVDDVETVGEYYLRVVVPPVAATVAATAAALVLGTLDVALGVVLAVFLALCGVVLPATTRSFSRPAAIRVVASRAEVAAQVTEGMSGLAELVALGAEQGFVDALERTDDGQRAASARLAAARGAVAALAALLTGATALVLLAIAVTLVGAGELDGVHLAMVPLVAIAAAEVVTPLTTVTEFLDRGRSAAGRLFDLVDAPPAVTEPEEPLPPPEATDVVVDGLWFTHSGGTSALLRGVSLSVPAGTNAAVVGPSGAGKSTLVSLLQRFVDYHTGSVRLGGTELRQMAAADVHDRIAVVAQHDHVFDTSVRDNLLLADGDAEDERLWQALDDACLGDWVRGLPEGLDTRVGEDANLLSGGERQRLLVARGLLTDAPVLVLDEATNHLDATTEAAVLANVRRRRAGRTTVTIAHHGAALEGIDLVLRLEDGACHEGPAARGRA